MKLQNDEKINIIILVTVMVSGLAFYIYKQNSKPLVVATAPVVQQVQKTQPRSKAVPYKVAAQRVPRQAVTQKVVSKRAPTNISASAALVPTTNMARDSKNTYKSTSFNKPTSWNQRVDEPLIQNHQSAKSESKNYDESDEGLLNQTLQKALEQGSKVAYIGEVPDLYAFDSRFFESYVEANGQPSLRPRRFDSYQMVDTSAGPKQMLVQREPYPVPANGMTNYKILNFAIIKAADDGAMLINLASTKVDRNQLQDSIQYARGRGAVVVTVAPPNR